jgi:hypothetical protein
MPITHLMLDIPVLADFAESSAELSADLRAFRKALSPLEEAFYAIEALPVKYDVTYTKDGRELQLTIVEGELDLEKMDANALQELVAANVRWRAGGGQTRPLKPRAKKATRSKAAEKERVAKLATDTCEAILAATPMPDDGYGTFAAMLVRMIVEDACGSDPRYSSVDDVLEDYENLGQEALAEITELAKRPGSCVLGSWGDDPQFFYFDGAADDVEGALALIGTEHQHHWPYYWIDFSRCLLGPIVSNDRSDPAVLRRRREIECTAFKDMSLLKLEEYRDTFYGSWDDEID